jgi:hypothetical protein
MFLNTGTETILLSDGTQKHVSEIKDLMARNMNAVLNLQTNQKGLYLRHSNSEVNVSEEMLSRGPMFCNALMSRGYKNILFVGHFNSGQSNWILDQEAGRMINVMPPERHEMHSFPDLNIVAQSIPMIMKTFDYDCEVTIARPPEDKHKGAMHQMYNAFSSECVALCSHQYKHGQSSWTLEGEHEKFDAVVFLGVPMQDQEVGFEDDQVREIFAPMCTPEFDMVDIYYGAPSAVKWFNGEEKDSKTMVDTAFTLRSIWDEDMSEGRPEESMIMHSMIKVF